MASVHVVGQISNFHDILPQEVKIQTMHVLICSLKLFKKGFRREAFLSFLVLICLVARFDKY
jgi:hypothetical protein